MPAPISWDRAWNHHTPACPRGKERRVVDPGASHLDLFCHCHENTAPQTGLNGTDVVWPADFTREEAHYWRLRHGLYRPGGNGCPRCHGSEWICENHPGQGWRPGTHDDGDGLPCPVCNVLAEDDGTYDLADMPEAQRRRTSAYAALRKKAAF